MATASEVDQRDIRQTFLYFGALTLLIYLVTPTGYLVDIQTSYLLKNQMHATATQVSYFRLLTAAPVYFAFVFGLTRDIWNPMGLRDRGYFLLFAPLTALVYVGMGVTRISYAGLFLGMFTAMVTFRFSMAAYQGLIALVGQEKLMSGRLSVLWNIINYIPTAGGAFASGYISADNLSARETFLISAGLALLLALMGLWKPASVFNHTYDRPEARGSSFVGDLKRLVKHRAVYPAVLICFLWNFAPGAATPLQFYLTNQLHASDSVYSYYYGIFALSFIPTLFVYGYLCKKVPLNKLLWWGTVIAVPQMIPLLFVHSAKLALLSAVPTGLMGGVATAAYIDLAMRSCPAGLQGTLMMMVDGVFWLSNRGGDLLGSAIYNSSPKHGFLYSVIATTAVYASILPLILWVPKELIATADGEPNPAIDAAVRQEIAESESA